MESFVMRNSAARKKIGKSDWSRKGRPAVFEVTIVDVETQVSCLKGLASSEPPIRIRGALPSPSVECVHYFTTYEEQYPYWYLPPQKVFKASDFSKG